MKETNLDKIKDTVTRYINNSQLKSINNTFGTTLDKVEWVDENTKNEIRFVVSISDTKGIKIDIRNKFNMDYEYISKMFDIGIDTFTEYLYGNYKITQENDRKIKDTIITKYLKVINTDNETDIGLMILADYAIHLYEGNVQDVNILTMEDKAKVYGIIEGEAIADETERQFIKDLYKNLLKEVCRILKIK